MTGNIHYATNLAAQEQQVLLKVAAQHIDSIQITVHNSRLRYQHVLACRCAVHVCRFVCIIDCSSSSSSHLSEALRIDEELSKAKGSIITMLLVQLLYDSVQHFYSLLCGIFLLLCL
jgi:hypothetical protein